MMAFDQRDVDAAGQILYEKAEVYGEII